MKLAVSTGKQHRAVQQREHRRGAGERGERARSHPGAVERRAARRAIGDGKFLAMATEEVERLGQTRSSSRSASYRCSRRGRPRGRGAAANATVNCGRSAQSAAAATDSLSDDVFDSRSARSSARRSVSSFRPRQCAVAICSERRSTRSISCGRASSDADDRIDQRAVVGVGCRRGGGDRRGGKGRVLVRRAEEKRFRPAAVAVPIGIPSLDVRLIRIEGGNLAGFIEVLGGPHVDHGAEGRHDAGSQVIEPGNRGLDPGQDRAHDAHDPAGVHIQYRRLQKQRVRRCDSSCRRSPSLRRCGAPT